MIDFSEIPTGRVQTVEEGLVTLETELEIGDSETAEFLVESTKDLMALFEKKVHADALKVYQEQLNKLKESMGLRNYRDSGVGQDLAVEE